MEITCNKKIIYKDDRVLNFNNQEKCTVEVYNQIINFAENLKINNPEIEELVIEFEDEEG